MSDLDRPYSRSQYNRALVLNALFDPFNVVLLAGMLIAGIFIGKLALLVPVALVVYGIAAARTYFDEDEAQKVLTRERSRRRRSLASPRVDLAALAPEIRGLVEESYRRRDRIGEAIRRAELPYAEVSDEVDGFVAAIEGTAGRAQLLYEALADTPPQAVAARLREVEGDPAKAELAGALRHQVAAQGRMGDQLQRFYDRMERLLVELDTVRANLVSVSASTDTENQERLAADVRGLRDEVGALADGMSEAYEAPSVP